jgi:hypothetical protein
MTGKLIRNPGELDTVAVILKRLYDKHKALMATGVDAEGKPFTQRSFAVMNLARAALATRGIKV